MSDTQGKFGKAPRPTAYRDTTSSDDALALALAKRLGGQGLVQPAPVEDERRSAQMAALQAMTGGNSIPAPMPSAEQQAALAQSAALGKAQEQGRDAQLDPTNPQDAEYLANKAKLAAKFRFNQ